MCCGYIRSCSKDVSQPSPCQMYAGLLLEAVMVATNESISEQEQEKMTEVSNYICNKPHIAAPRYWLYRATEHKEWKSMHGWSFGYRNHRGACS